MLSEQDIRQALHAERVVPLTVTNPHGPLGLEHLACEVADLLASPHAPAGTQRVGQPVTLSPATWAKLDQLARTATPHPITAAEMAAAILEQALANVP
jgi:hypothetical protein